MSERLNVYDLQTLASIVADRVDKFPGYKPLYDKVVRMLQHAEHARRERYEKATTSF